MDTDHAANDRASMFVSDDLDSSTYLHVSSEWNLFSPCSILDFRDSNDISSDQIIRIQKNCCGCIRNILVQGRSPIIACKAPRFVWNFFVRVEYRQKMELIVSDETSNSLRMFSRGSSSIGGDKFKLESSLGIGYDSVRFDRPMGIAVNSEGHIIVADSGNNRVQVLDESTREVIMILDGRDLNFRYDESKKDNGDSTRGAKWSGEFRDPCDVCVDESDNIYIADTGNRCVHCYTREGNHVNTWGEGYGMSEECFVKPCSLTTFLRVPPGLRSRSVNFVLEDLYKKKLFSLDAYKDACVRLKICGVDTVGSLLDTPKERVQTAWTSDGSGESLYGLEGI